MDGLADRTKGGWIEFRGKLRQTWASVIDNERERVRAQREQLVGYLQQHAARERRGPRDAE